jgi:hypothetical protein
MQRPYEKIARVVHMNRHDLNHIPHVHLGNGDPFKVTSSGAVPGVQFSPKIINRHLFRRGIIDIKVPENRDDLSMPPGTGQMTDMLRKQQESFLSPSC